MKRFVSIAILLVFLLSGSTLAVGEKLELQDSLPKDLLAELTKYTDDFCGFVSNKNLVRDRSNISFGGGYKVIYMGVNTAKMTSAKNLASSQTEISYAVIMYADSIPVLTMIVGYFEKEIRIGSITEYNATDVHNAALKLKNKESNICITPGSPWIVYDIGGRTERAVVAGKDSTGVFKASEFIDWYRDETIKQNKLMDEFRAEHPPKSDSLVDTVIVGGGVDVSLFTPTQFLDDSPVSSAFIIPAILVVGAAVYIVIQKKRRTA